MNKRRPRIYCYGDLCLDIQAEAEQDGAESPTPDTTFRQLSATVAGAAVNCATAAAFHRAEVHLIGNLGQDPNGDLIAAHLAANNINAEFVARIAGETGRVVFMRQPAGETAIYSYRGVNAQACETLPESFEPGDFLYLSGYAFQDKDSLATAIELQTRAQAAGAQCVLDPSRQFAANFRKRHKDAIRGMRLITPNLAEARLMSGCYTPSDCALVLRNSGARIAVVKLGLEGCYVDSSEYRGTVPGNAAPGNPVDRPVRTAGAGDAFCGTLLAALTQAATLRAAARQANEYVSRFIADSL